jgi:hypothetical protein
MEGKEVHTDVLIWKEGEGRGAFLPSHLFIFSALPILADKINRLSQTTPSSLTIYKISVTISFDRSFNPLQASLLLYECTAKKNDF